MKRTIVILLVAVSLAASIPAFADEPNTPVNTDYNAIEARLIALENRLTALEERIAQLESRRPAPAPRGPNPTPVPQADPNRDALRIERLTKQINEAKESIQLDKIRIKVLPQRYFSGGLYRFSKTDIPEVLRSLDIAKENIHFLNEQESDYKKIIQLAEKNPDLGVDVMKTKTDLIKCQGDGKKAEQELERLRELILYNRDLFDKIPR